LLVTIALLETTVLLDITVCLIPVWPDATAVLVATPFLSSAGERVYRNAIFCHKM